MLLSRPLMVLAAAVPLALGASAAWAGNGASQVPVESNTSGSCSTGPSGAFPQINDSFAIIKADRNGNVSAEVSVKGADPNHTYQLDLVQTPGGQGCEAGQFTLTTNGQGNGSTHISEPEDAGTTGAFVLFVPSGTIGYAATPDVPLG